MSFSNGYYGEDSCLVYQLEMDDVLETMSFGQITNNTIEGLAPATFTQMDTTRSIRYNITSHMTLEDFLQRPIKKKDFLRVLSGIVAAARAAQEYMIDPSVFLLNKKYVYLKTSPFEVRMICLPVHRPADEQISVQKFLWDLVTTTKTDESENREYQIELMGKLNFAEPRSLEEIWNILESMSQNGGAVEAGKPVKKEPEKAPNLEHKEAPAVPASVEQDPGYTWEGNLKDNFGDGAREKEEKDSWLKRFMGSKKEKAPKKEKRNGKKDADETAFDDGDFSGSFHPDDHFAIPGFTDGVSNKEKNVSVNQKSHKAESPKTDKQPDVQKVADEKYGGTVIIAGDTGNDGTMWEPAEQQKFRKVNARLFRESNKEMIPVSGTIFRIGTDYDYTDYPIRNNKTVSSSHAWILMKDNVYYIKDLNSKFHTFVDEERIPVDVEVPIKHGSQIRMGSERFVFYLY